MLMDQIDKDPLGAKLNFVGSAIGNGCWGNTGSFIHINYLQYIQYNTYTVFSCFYLLKRSLIKYYPLFCFSKTSLL